MRGIIDPYTLGFSISLIVTTNVYMAHSNKQTDEAIERPTHIKKQAVASAQTEDYKELF